MDEIGERLGTIDGLRVKPYWANSVAPPAALVSLPDRIEYDQTYGRGSDSMDLEVLVLIGKASDRASRDKIARYANGSGEGSVKATLEATGYETCDDVRVVSCEFGTEPIAGGGAYLVAVFQLNITGSGA